MMPSLLPAKTRYLLRPGYLKWFTRFSVVTWVVTLLSMRKYMKLWSFA